MRHWLWRALGLGAALLRFATPLAAQDLAPTDTLPAALQAAVRASGCQVPHWPKFHNDGSVTPGPAFVWRAAVRTAGQVDWVVGCDRDHKRTALVFPAPITASSRPVLALEIPGEISGDPADEGCEVLMHIATEAQVRSAMRQLPRSSPLRALLQRSSAPLHAGIADGICEGGGSNIRYWTGSKWVTLPDGYNER